VHSTLAICWGAQAMLRYFHGVPKYPLSRKAFGVYRHRNLKPSSPFLRGFSDDFSIPVSRWTEIRTGDLPEQSGLEMLMESDETGPCLINDPAHNSLYMFNHMEAGIDIHVPHGYFPNDDPHMTPENRWRSHAHLLFGNWINEVYQTTPYDVSNIGKP